MTELIHGDCLDVLRSMPDCSFDAVVTDPPYGLSFMGKKWDYDVPGVEVWAECLRVLKPGGHLLAFAGTRTQHRMAVRIEDAGFEIRDMIAWVYGSGFPKSLDVSKAIDKRGGLTPWQQEFAEHLRAIKPAGVRAADINAHIANGTKSNFWGHFIDTKSQPLLPTVDQYRRLKEILPIDPSWDEQFLPPAEREVVGQKTAGIANPGDHDRHTIGASEAVVVDITAPATEAARQWQGWGTALKPSLEPITVARKPLIGTVAENVLQHGTGAINVDGGRVGTDAGWAYPNGRGGNGWHGRESLAANLREPMAATQGRWPANFIHDGSEEATNLLKDSARFFYCAKASKADRDAGCDGLELGSPPASARSKPAEGRQNALGVPRHNHHPTVKPTDLMRYLCRLVTPPNGVVLDPFMGSGSTGKAAALEGFSFIGIEREAEYVSIAQARINHVTND